MDLALSIIIIVMVNEKKINREHVVQELETYGYTRKGGIGDTRKGGIGG